MGENANRAEAERLLGIAEKLLQGKDLNGSREFAILAQETEPLLEGSDQILAVVDVLLASERRVNNHLDWYAILQIDRRSLSSDDPDLDLIKKQYRRLALLLHPDKNKFALADSAFRLVADAWAVLSDTRKKLHFDGQLNLYSKVDLVALKNQSQRGLHHHQFRRDLDFDQQQQQKLPVRRGWREAGNSSGDRGTANSNAAAAGGGGEARMSSFWTACPYCYNLYEYPKVYEDCCLRCQNCQRAFHAAMIPSLPPLVPGKEAYYCCWGFFPLGFTVSNSASEKKQEELPTARAAPVAAAAPADGFQDVRQANPTPASKKRGRPRKNVVA
ncbi:uncharacterized protein LOC127808786 [Diospyros lotus]|uniref:uncharacterized protein LOC127808786 n=1 Tax=Diospyros lotus TaxID=55363 RepID=UPI00225B31C7|nr:uncharacterized protein LOC127808786 [Diospyros lotus]XP_052203367.1 uncharacterized protein LOC127808786 [Diospyros lotus]